MEQNFESRYRLVREIIETAVLTVLMFVIINLTIQNYDVSGPSMEPSLHDQERIMVDKVSYLFHSPARGDVIVFTAPLAPGDSYVKRIIALPGDVISVDGTTVIVNGVTLNETYVDPAMQENSYAPIISHVVPPNAYFVLGDNRRNSSDSRAWGFVPRADITGQAVLVYWPLGQDNSGFLPDVSAVFANVRQPRAASLPSSAVDGIFVSSNLSSHVGEMLIGGAPRHLFCFFQQAAKEIGGNIHWNDLIDGHI